MVGGSYLVGKPNQKPCNNTKWIAVEVALLSAFQELQNTKIRANRIERVVIEAEVLVEVKVKVEMVRKVDLVVETNVEQEAEV
jgi:hypothetical protein